MISNSQIATRPENGRIVTQSETDALIATLPKWLAYLVGAFPAAQVNKMTYLAYETAFAEIDPALMLTAVQAVAKTHKYASFPTIAEIHKAAEAVTEQVYLADRLAIKRHKAIALQRKKLLDAAYHGELDAGAWRRFANDCEAQGYEFNADWARRKLVQFENSLQT